MSDPSNAQLIAFAKTVLAILQSSSDDEPEIRQVYQAAERHGVNTRYQSTDD
jgi:hypothetical protein